MILAVLLICFLALVSAQNSPDYEFLMDFFTYSNGMGWKNHAGWAGPPGSEGTWFGVTVDPYTLHVTKLELADNNLVGSICTSVGAMKMLDTLDLHTNNLTHIQEFGKMKGPLSYCDLTDNQFKGTIPSWVADSDCQL